MTAPADALLEVDRLETGYAALRVVRGVSFSVSEREIVAIIGANGVGKTTTMKAIVGALPVWSGSVRLAGRRISGLSANRIVAAGIAIVPEGRRVFAELTVEENLLVGAHVRRDPAGIAADLAGWFEFFPVLHERRGQPAGQLSGGEQQMLALGRALMSRPRLLLLDEPSLGLAPKIIEVVYEMIPRIRERGTSIVVVEQNARAALGVADRALVMRRGEIVLEGSAPVIAADRRVAEIYLGYGSASTGPMTV